MLNIMDISIKCLHGLQATTVKTQAFVPQMIIFQLSQKELSCEWKHSLQWLMSEWHKNLLQELVLRVSCSIHIKCFNQLIIVLIKRGAWLKPEALKARRCSSGATELLAMVSAKTSDFSMLCLFICKMGTINARLWYIPQKVLWKCQSHIRVMFFQPFLNY